jgi:PAS domain S-box-containing protein
MQKQNAASIITFLSGLIIFILAIAFPLVYFFVSYEYIKGSIETEGKISAGQIMKIIASNPSAWEFEQERLQTSLSSYPRKGYPEKWRTINSKNEVIAESHTTVSEPYIMRTFELLDAGTVVGRLEIYRSLMPLFKKTGILSLLMLPIGIITFLIIRFIPIKMIHKTEQALKESSELLEKTFSNLREAVFIIDSNTFKIIKFNTAAEKMFGFEEKELSEQNIMSFFADSSCDAIFRQKTDHEIMTEGFIYINNAQLKGKNNTVFPAEYTIVPLFDENKLKTALLCVINDITERKKLEEDTLRSQKLESLGILAGGIAHDFNNLLTAIVGCVSALKLYTDPQDESYQMLEHAEKASMRAKDLTQQLLTFSKGGEPVKKIISVSEIIKNSVGFTLRGTKAKSKLIIPENLWYIFADEGQVSQVINNILINAFQAMPDGGVITILCENITLENNEVPNLISGDYVKIVIEDQGTGIAHENLKKIFDPYFTTKPDGNGLGLATSYSIIKKHKGTIRVQSEIGKGTAFTIYLPALRDIFENIADFKNEPVKGKGRILIMDDEESVRLVAGWMLNKIGYEVDFAKDGFEMINKYKTEFFSGKKYDAVIIDLTIPGSMSGDEAVKKLLEIDPEAKAIASSGYFNSPIMSDFLSFGFKAVIVKPYKINELSEIVSKIINLQPVL